MKTTTSLIERSGWLLLILLVAATLRLYDISDVPPGLTHDEADHGITAWQIVNGARGVYFTVGYGREPLYDYSTAALMSFLGPTYLAGRLSAVYFSMLLIAGMYAWVRLAFDRTIALLTAAGMAVGFWALMTSRQSLRSETFPTLFVLALLFYWQGVKNHRYQRKRFGPPAFSLAGILLGMTFYTYVPARGMWTILPVFLIYAAVTDRPLFRRVWRGTILMLAIAGVVASPLFIYLLAHRGAEARIWQLSKPLTTAFAGDPTPLLDNIVGSLRLFTISGDTFWRYNIPGRPLLQPVMGALFYLGLATAFWRAARPGAHRWLAAACSVALLWLLAGLAPVLITGPRLSTTQAIGMQPVIYLFAAVGLMLIGQSATRIQRKLGDFQALSALGRLGFLIPFTLFSVTAVLTARDYFGTWASAPEVRVQYESTMVTAMRYLNEEGNGAVAVSTASPGRFHSQAIAELTLRNEKVTLHWFDGRHSLLLPASNRSEILVPGFTPLAPGLEKYFETAVLVDSLPLRATDLDRPLNVYRMNGPTVAAEWVQLFEPVSNGLAGPIRFGEAAEFLGYDLQTPEVPSGGAVQIATLWRALRPIEGGVVFTHIQGSGGTPVAQQDRLDVPSDAWRPDDMFIQLHQVQMPLETTLDKYPIAIGICQQTPPDCLRLPILTGEHEDDLLRLTAVSVTR